MVWYGIVHYNNRLDIDLTAIDNFVIYVFASLDNASNKS